MKKLNIFLLVVNVVVLVSLVLLVYQGTGYVDALKQYQVEIAKFEAQRADWEKKTQEWQEEYSKWQMCKSEAMTSLKKEHKK